MTPVIPYLLGLGRLILECAAYLIAGVMIWTCSTFVMGFLCGLVFGAKDVPTWVQALADRAAPQAWPMAPGATTTTQNPRWPPDAARRH